MARNPDTTYDAPDLLNTIDISTVPDFDIMDYNINDDKDYKKLISRVEKICRSSYEYKAFINYLRDYADMNKCSFMKYITNAENRKIRIEIHHEPITLFDIVTIIANKRITMRESMDEDMIAKEVMWNHYKLHVGLIPLSETVHEIVHNQYLFIPTFAILGFWREFIEEYKDFVPQDIINKLDRLDQLSENYDINKETEVLTPGFVHVNVEDPEYQASEEELYNLTKEILDNTMDKK